MFPDVFILPTLKLTRPEICPINLTLYDSDQHETIYVRIIRHFISSYGRDVIKAKVFEVWVQTKRQIKNVYNIQLAAGRGAALLLCEIFPFGT